MAGVLSGEAGAVRAVVARGTGDWVLDAMGADRAVLEGAITVVTFWTLLAVHLRKTEE